MASSSDIPALENDEPVSSQQVPLRRSGRLAGANAQKRKLKTEKAAQVRVKGGAGPSSSSSSSGTRQSKRTKTEHRRTAKEEERESEEESSDEEEEEEEIEKKQKSKKDVLRKDKYIQSKGHKWMTQHWGKRLKSDSDLLRRLTMYGAAVGMSMSAVAGKEPGYNKVFKNFDISKVAKITEGQLRKVAGMKNAIVIRNFNKLRSVVKNAKAIQKVSKEHGSFLKYLDGFVKNFSYKGSPPAVHGGCPHFDPKLMAVATALSKHMKKQGFSFVGPGTLGFFLASTGIAEWKGQ